MFIFFYQSNKIKNVYDVLGFKQILNFHRELDGILENKRENFGYKIEVSGANYGIHLQYLQYMKTAAKELPTCLQLQANFPIYWWNFDRKFKWQTKIRYLHLIYSFTWQFHFKCITTFELLIV